MVVIKDAKIPKNCFECILYEENLKFCIVGSQGCVDRYAYDLNEKPSWCPLVEIPDINNGKYLEIQNNLDYISRHTAIDALCSVCGADCDKSEFVYSEKQEEQVILCPEHYVLTQLPSAQPEQKKGEWIPQNYNKTNGMVSTAVYYYPKCSVCGQYANYTNFCPNCGADMRGEQK